ncbi:MAG: hypothetical protein AAFR61_08500 [Bacteroidota bacterium]
MQHFTPSSSFFRPLWLVGISMLMLTVGCKQEEDPVSPVPFIQLSEPVGEFDLNDLENAVYRFTISINPPPEVTVQEVIISRRYNRTDFINKVSVNTFPADVEVRLADVVASLDGLEVEDLASGDFIRLGFEVKAVGREICYIIPQFFFLNINCSSQLAGTYITRTSGKAGPGGGGTFSNILSEVSLTEIGPSRYRVSDLSGGMFKTVWGGSAEEGVIVDSCNSILVEPFTDQWDDTFQGNGYVRNDSLVIFWQTSYGDAGTSIYLK